MRCSVFWFYCDKVDCFDFCFFFLWLLKRKVVVGVKGSLVRASEHSDDSLDSELGRYVRSIVYGALDGIVTTFAICSSGEGAHMSLRVTLVLGTSNLFADAGEKQGKSDFCSLFFFFFFFFFFCLVSMAFGDYLSTRAELSHSKSLWDQSQEAADKGVERVRAGFVSRGLSEEQASRVVELLAASDEALSHAVRAELGISSRQTFESVRNHAMTHGMVTLLSFLGFGSVPLLAYAMSGQAGGTSRFLRAIGWTASTLFLLGVVESFVTNQSMLTSGLETVATGVVAAAIAFFIGKYVGDYTDDTNVQKKKKTK